VHRNIAAAAAAVLALCAGEAGAQTLGDVVMRRPLPHDATPSSGSPGTPQTPSEQSDVPSTPAETVCDEGNAATAKLTAVKWVENGWSDGGMNAESCRVQKMTYTCQATYTCTVGGRQTSFVSDAADTVCSGSKGDVGYPGDTPDPTRFPADRSLADQVTWYITKTDGVVARQQAGGAAATGSSLIRSAPWVRNVDQVNWWVPGEYPQGGYRTYVRIFINPGTGNLYDASSEICNLMREAGHPCSNYYSHEGGSVFVAYIL
jgi:hypothetical protein